MGNRGFKGWSGRGTSGSGNKRVHNATSVLMEDGVKADSKLEAYMYSKLVKAGIYFDFHHAFVLVDRFTWRGEKIRAITWRVDFHFGWCKMVIDTKGFVTEKADLKIKIWKSQHGDMELKLPKNRQECDKEFLYILSKWVQYEGSFGTLKPEDLKDECHGVTAAMMDQVRPKVDENMKGQITLFGTAGDMSRGVTPLGPVRDIPGEHMSIQMVMIDHSKNTDYEQDNNKGQEEW